MVDFRLTGRRSRTDTPIFAGHFEGVSAELLRIVDVGRLRDTGRRPSHLFRCSQDMYRCPAHAVIETQCDRQDRRRIEGNVNPKSDPGRNIDGNRQIGALKWAPVHVINQNDVRRRVIDLNDLQRGRNFETTGTRIVLS